MLQLDDLRVFAKIVETESLTRAGEALGIPKSTISRKMTKIEEHLGVQLLHRSTHAVTVTEQGMLFFEYAVRCLGVLRDGERAVQNQHTLPKGLLRLAVPYELDRSLLGPLLAEFLGANPGIRVVNSSTHDPVGLLREGFDLAITPGPLPSAESTLMATKLGSTDFGIYAAPAYIERSGQPRSHLDLPRFDLLAGGQSDRREQWRLRRGSQQAIVEFRPRLVSNDLMLLRQIAVSGLGIALLPAFACKYDLAEGRLIELLPEWRVSPTHFHAIFPKHQVVPLRVRALIDFLVERLRPALSWDVPSAGPRPTRAEPAP